MKRGEQIGGVRGDPDLWSGRAQFGRLRPRSRFTYDAADSAGRSGRCVHCAGEFEHYCAAGGLCIFLTGRRLLHTLEVAGRTQWRRKIWGELSRVAGRCGANDRLHPCSRRGYIRRSWCAGFCRAAASAAYTGAMFEHPGARHSGEPARRSRSRPAFHGSDVRVSGIAAVRHRDWRWQDGFCVGASCAGCCATGESGWPCVRSGEHVAAAASVDAKRMHGNDRSRSGEQRSESLPRTDRAQRTAHTHRHHRPACDSPGGHRVSGSRLRYSGDRSRRGRISERPFHSGGGCGRPRAFLLLHHRFRAGDFVAFRQHRVCGFSALVQSGRA